MSHCKVVVSSLDTTRHVVGRLQRHVASENTVGFERTRSS